MCTTGLCSTADVKSSAVEHIRVTSCIRAGTVHWPLRWMLDIQLLSTSGGAGAG